MKLWIKFLMGSLLGVLCALIFRIDGRGVLDAVAGWTIRIGRYTVIPLVFSSSFIAIYRLREERTYLKTGVWIVISIIGQALLLTAVAVVSSKLVTLQRFAITGMEKEAAPDSLPNIGKMLFPSSAFSALCNGECVAASFLVGAFAGGAAAGDKALFRPLVTVFDALSVLCYNVVTLFYEMLPVGVIALSWKWVLDYRLMIKAVQALPLIMLLFIDLCFVAFILYPLLLIILAHEKRPYRVLYAALAPLMAALLSGDVNFCLPLLTRMGSEDFGIRRRTNASICPLFASFARAGSSVVAIVCFVAVWHSYSSLPIPINTLVGLCTSSFLLSFLLCGVPSGGAFTVFAIVCAAYGKEFLMGSAIILPCALFLSSIAAAFDTLTCAFALVLIASKTNTMKVRPIKSFI